MAKRIIDHVREVIRKNPFYYITEQNYVGWLYRLIILLYKRHPKDIDFDFDEIIIRVEPFNPFWWYCFSAVLKDTR